MTLVKKKKADKTLGKVKQSYSLLNQRAAKHIKDNAKDYDDDGEEEDDTAIEDTGMFKKHVERITKLEEAGLRGEAYDIEVLKSLRQLSLELIPIAEENYRKFPIHTAASAVNQYINQSREILNDIRALEDFQSRAEMIVKVFAEECEIITKSLISNVQKLQSTLSDQHSAKNNSKYCEELMRSQANAIISARDRASERIMGLMVSSEEKKRK